MQISPYANFYNSENIEIGDNVRIDDFCILSAGAGGIKIGSNIHIACYVSMIGAGRIEVDDFSQIAARCNILSSTDDFSGAYMVGPCLPLTTRKVISAPVTIARHAVLGCNTVVLPGVRIGENSATAAFTLVNRDLMAGMLYKGIPCKPMKERLPKMFPDSDFENQRTWYD